VRWSLGNRSVDVRRPQFALALGLAFSRAALGLGRDGNAGDRIGHVSFTDIISPHMAIGHAIPDHCVHRHCHLTGVQASSNLSGLKLGLLSGQRASETINEGLSRNLLAEVAPQTIDHARDQAEVLLSHAYGAHRVRLPCRRSSTSAFARTRMTLAAKCPKSLAGTKLCCLGQVTKTICGVLSSSSTVMRSCLPTTASARVTWGDD
jgi:hypothetical protein